LNYFEKDINGRNKLWLYCLEIGYTVSFILGSILNQIFIPQYFPFSSQQRHLLPCQYVGNPFPLNESTSRVKIL